MSTRTDKNASTRRAEIERELEEERRAVLEENARLEAELIAQIPVMLENIRTGKMKCSRRQRRELARIYGSEFLEEG